MAQGKEGEPSPAELCGRPRGVPLVGSQTGRGEDHPWVLGGSAHIAQTERVPRGVTTRGEPSRDRDAFATVCES